MGAEPVLPGSLSIVLREPMLIAPAEPTENFVYFLSNLDQNIAYILRTVYFYKANEDKSTVDPANVLREALRKVLVHYRPVAGRLGVSSEGKLNVICNDQGVLFVEADADATLADIASTTTTLTQFVYEDPSAKNMLELPLMIVQVTRLNCGGFAVGLAMNHAVYDGIAAMEFLNSWAETARGVPISVPPYLDRSILKHRVPLQIEFPHVEFAEIDALSEDQQIKTSADVVYSSFCFDPQSLEALKSNLLQEGLLKKCTTFETLTALVWRARTKALNVPDSQQAKLLFAINVRSKCVPPLPIGYLGNGIALICAKVAAEDVTHKSLSHVVGLVQEAIRMVDDKYVRSAIDYFEQTRARPSLTSTLLVTTWSRLSLNAIDHGWGDPVYSGPTTLPEPEVVLFLSCGKDRKSIKVVLGLPAAAMEKFRLCLMDESLVTSSQFESKIKELTLWDIL